MVKTKSQKFNKLHFNNFIEERVKLKECCQNDKIVFESQTGKTALELQICFGQLQEQKQETIKAKVKSRNEKIKANNIYINNDSIFERN